MKREENVVQHMKKTHASTNFTGIKKHKQKIHRMVQELSLLDGNIGIFMGITIWSVYLFGLVWHVMLYYSSSILLVASIGD